MLRLALVPLLLALCAADALAQPLTWTPRADLNAEMPASIRLYEGVSTDPMMRAWAVRADPSDTTWTLRTVLSDAEGGAETTGSFAAKYDAFVAINGGYFGGGSSFSLVIDQGVLRSHNVGAVNRSGTTFYPTRSAFGVLGDGTPDVAWVYNVAGTTYAYPAPSPNRQNAPQPQPSATFPEGGAPWPAVDAIGGGPVIVQGGEPFITWEEEVFFGSGIGAVTDFQPRTAIGYTAEGEFLLLVVDGRQGLSRGASLVELAEIMIGLGAVEAVNLDGGGSTTMVADGTLINRPEGNTFQRAVVSAVLLAPRQEAPADPSLYFDTGDACCYREAGPWFESANTPFWGETRSRLVATGDGSHRATFVLDDARVVPGTYEVAAWWVPSFNRATNTPYTVYSGGEGTTVRVDQTPAASANRWNVLGTFTLARGDSVVVSNEASGTTSPAFVSVDAIRLVRAGGTSAEGPPSGPEAVAVYPNPARGLVHVRTGTEGPWRAEIVDLLGREVARFEGEGGAASQDLSGLAPGVYLLRVARPEGVSVRPFVLAR